MNHRPKVCCVLCQRSEETEITGALSTKDEVTAHQNCLLFSSGIYCQNSPEFDDLFGFSVEDVMKEVKRGGKLTCNKCKRKGATAGCEVGRCKKSYHYPCAIQEGAKAIEEPGEGKYELLCFKHYQQQQPRDSDSVNGLKAETSKNHNGAGSSKVYCLACENTEGKISLEYLSNGVIMLYCDKHTPSSYKRNASGKSYFGVSRLLFLRCFISYYHFKCFSTRQEILRCLDYLCAAVTQTHPAVRHVFPRFTDYSQSPKIKLLNTIFFSSFQNDSVI
uniref:PHD-type domain-containing protein n=1 Tax=Lates calcarifer TaxID=8187 RepID=A0A4W6D277_LATCA